MVWYRRLAFAMVWRKRPAFASDGETSPAHRPTVGTPSLQWDFLYNVMLKYCSVKQTMKSFALLFLGLACVLSAQVLDMTTPMHGEVIYQENFDKTTSLDGFTFFSSDKWKIENDINAIKQIIDVELKGLYKRIEDMGYKMELSNEAKEFVATKGYDVQFGARPLKRAIQTYIEDGISDLIVNGDLPEQAVIHVDKMQDQDKLSFTV